MCMHRPSAWSTPWRRAVIPDIYLQLFDENKYKADPLAREFKNPRRAVTIDILDILLYGMDLEATDPRDKVFALLGFLDKASNDDLEEEIRPDYKKSVSRVFADFTRWWIRTHNSLRILSATHTNAGRTWLDMRTSSTSRDEPTRPTWSLWHDGRNSWAHATLAAWDTTRYDASAGRFAHILLSPPDVLRIEGCILGRIDKISTFPYFRQDDGLNELRNVYNQLFEPTNARNVWTSSAFQAGEWDEAGEKLLINEYALYDHANAHWDFLQRNRGAIQCHHACYFTTNEKDKGLCPPMAKKGDIVVVLFGGRVPYILRKTTNPATQDPSDEDRQYEFIGECYIQDYMRGVAMLQLEDPEHARSSQIFSLI